jgi:ribosomal-protein-alanine N-acetyltransferase
MIPEISRYALDGRRGMEFTLRPWRTDDAESVAALADNAKIAANLRDGFPHPYTSDNARAFIAACLGADETSKLFYAIDIGGAAAGSIGVFGKDDVYRKTAELGYWLGEPFWGGGVMTRAVYLICRIAFSKLDIVRIEAEPYAWNAASRRVLEKTGFELEGVLEKNVFKNGALGDSCVYALIRGDLDREALGGLDKERLWELFPVVLSDYRDEWVMYFMLEKTVLEYFVGPENIFRISHIGSTAVPGLLSKPTVDILPEIKSGVDCQALITAMRLAGYGLNYRPDKASPHLTFIRGYTSEGFRGQVFHVHVRYPGDWDELYFRDYLRADPCAAEQYAGLKRSLLKDYVNDRDGYTGAKTDFIRRATERARAQLGQIYGAES